MSVAVVDDLEAIEVDEQHRHQAGLTFEPAERVSETGGEHRPVRQPRQGVAGRLQLQPPAVGDVSGYSEPRIACQGRVPLQPAVAAVLAAVAVLKAQYPSLGGAVGVTELERALRVLAVDELRGVATDEL